MTKIRKVLVLAGLTSASSGQESNFAEYFSFNPLRHGWRIFCEDRLSLRRKHMALPAHLPA
jgi:hypothetical protein